MSRSCEGRVSRPLRGRMSRPKRQDVASSRRQDVARNRGRMSLRAFLPKTTSSPCLLSYRLLVFKRLLIGLQRDD